MNNKTNELKKVLRPLIKSCIKEMLFEEGFLRQIVSECVQGVSTQETIVERKQPQQQINKQNSEYSTKIQETKRKLMDSFGKDSYNGVNLFEGLEPISEDIPDSNPVPGVKGSENIKGAFAQAGITSNDPGVNLDIFKHLNFKF